MAAVQLLSPPCAPSPAPPAVDEVVVVATMRDLFCDSAAMRQLAEDLSTGDETILQLEKQADAMERGTMEHAQTMMKIGLITHEQRERTRREVPALFSKVRT